MKLKPVIFGRDRIITVDEIPQKKLLDAQELVDMALTGKIGFCYKEVPKIPLSGGFEYNQEIIRQKRVVNTSMYNKRAKTARKFIKKLESKAKDHVLFDESAYKKMKLNYNRLHSALVLLSSNAMIHSYTLKPNGTLRVRKSYKSTQTTEIKQSITYQYESKPVLRTKAQVEKEYLNDKIFCGKYDPDRIRPQGKINKETEVVIDSVGGGIEPSSYFYKKVGTPEIKELSEFNHLFKGLTYKDLETKLVKFMAFTLYLKERYNENNGV